MTPQHLAMLEGLALGLEARGEKSAAHEIRQAIKNLKLARWIILNLLTESQLDVVPPEYPLSIRFITES